MSTSILKETKETGFFPFRQPFSSVSLTVTRFAPP